MEHSALHTPLYHYTDVHGLQGIIQDQAIWASNIRYLNDSQEFDYEEGELIGPFDDTPHACIKGEITVDDDALLRVEWPLLEAQATTNLLLLAWEARGELRPQALYEAIFMVDTHLEAALGEGKALRQSIRIMAERRASA